MRRDRAGFHAGPVRLCGSCGPAPKTIRTASLQFRWLAQPRLHGLFVGEILVFLLFKGKLIKHANHRMRQEAVYT